MGAPFLTVLKLAVQHARRRMPRELMGSLWHEGSSIGVFFGNTGVSWPAYAGPGWGLSIRSSG